MLVYSVDQIVRLIIEYDSDLSEYDDSDLGLTKLQILLYYVQAHYLSQFAKPLFKEKITKSTHGIFISSIYNDLKNFDKHIDLLSRINAYECVNNKYKTIDIEPEQLEFIKNTVYYYNRLARWFLRDLVKAENYGINPWSKTKNGQEISHELMQKYFAMPEFSARIND